MRALAAYIRLAEAINRFAGLIAAALVVPTVLVCAGVALARYGFSVGRVWLQELYVVCFGISFMLAAGWIYAIDGHIRVDVMQARFSPRTRAVIEIIGNLAFVLPWVALTLWSAKGFVAISWQVLERSPQADGLPFIYLVKAVIPLAMVLLALQSLAVVARKILFLAGRDDLLPPTPAAALATTN